MKIFINIFIVGLIFTGCSVLQKPIDPLASSTNFSSLSKKLSRDICYKIQDNSTLYITDFVNESNLKNRSQLGFLLSSELKVNILKKSCGQNIAIKNLQLSKSLQIGKYGSKILTRDIKNLKIKNLKDNRDILIGTYMMTKNQLILFLKLVNLKTGNTIATSRISTKITNEIKELEGINTNEKANLTIYQPFHL
jgi:hypothetical protein